jgi:predicted nucleic acid-binding protein
MIALMVGAVLDTNVLIYAFADDPRSGKAQDLLHECQFSLSSSYFRHTRT